MKNVCSIVIALMSFITIKGQNTFPSSGNVGIGTMEPVEKLQINEGDLSVYGLNTSRYMRFAEVKKQGAFINYDGTKNILNIGVHEASSDDVSHDKNSISIVRKTGNVGIGTTTPTAKLDVSGNLKLGNFTLNNGLYSEKIGELELKGYKIIDHTKYDNYILGWGWNSYFGDHTTLTWGGAGSGKKLIISEAKGLLWSGNVGIGTTTPDAKLAVNGDIHTKEIKVDLNGWADFVFENDYELPSLKQVEKHIQEKGHLADIPSAKEVAENGVKLGEMNKKLLQKIEELTLYTIAQEKQLKKQEERLKSQDARLEKLEKLLENQSTKK